MPRLRRGGPLGWRLGWPSGRRIAAAALLLASACGGQAAETTPYASGPLASGEVARVGERTIAGQTVAGIAAAQKVSLEEARRRAIFDALLALGAESDRPDQAAAARTRVLARALLRKLADDAATQPISLAEVNAAAQIRWTFLDRPAGARAVHAVVQLKPDADEAERKLARATAERLLAALKPLEADIAAIEQPPFNEAQRFDGTYAARKDPAWKAFEKAAKAVDGQGSDVLVQPLQVVDARGRVIDHNERRPYDDPRALRYHQEFADAVNQLPRRGALSGVVGSPSGFHVIMLLERTPSRRLDDAAVRAELTPLIVRERGQATEKALLERLRKQSPSEIETNADALLGLISIRDD